MRSLVLLTLVLNLALAQADATARLSKLIPDLTRFGDAPQIWWAQPGYVVLAGVVNAFPSQLVKAAQVWDIGLNKKLLDLKDRFVLCSSKDWIVTTGLPDQKQLILYNLAGHTHMDLPALTDHAYSCDLSFDGKLLFVSQPKGVWVFDLSKRELINQLSTAVKPSRRSRYFGFYNLTTTIALSKNAKAFATGSFGGGIWLWRGEAYDDRVKLTAPPRPSRNLALQTGYQIAHAGRVRHLQFSEDANYLISLGSDGSLRVWDTTKQTLFSEIEGGIFSFALDSPNQTLYVGAGYTIKALAFPELRLLGSFVGHADWVRGLALNEPAGKLYSTTQNAETLKVWDISTRTEIASYGKAWASFSPGRKWLAYTQKDGRVRILDAKSGKVHRIFKGLLPFPRQIYTFVQNPVFSPSGNKIAASSCFLYRLVIETTTGGGKTMVWDIKSGKVEQIIEKPLHKIRFAGEQVSLSQSVGFDMYDACQKR